MISPLVTGHLAVCGLSDGVVLGSSRLPGNVAARRRHTSLPALLDRLPLELLCLVWAALPQTDRIAVTHVCSAWRRNAIACRAVWSTVEASLTAHERCACLDQRLPARPQCIRSSLSTTRLVLERSGNTALSLSLRVLVPDPADSWLTDLVSILMPHAARLEHIHIEAWNTGYPAALLDEFNALPALRCFSTERVYLAGLADTVPFTSRVIALPNLSRIDLGMAETTWPSEAGFSLPNLIALRIHISMTDEIVRALDACPRLAVLHLVFALEDDAVQRKASADAIAAHCRRGVIREVLVDGVGDDNTGDAVTPDEDWVFAAFGHPEVKTLRLIYDEFSLDGLKRFWDMGGEVKLSVTHRKKVLVFEATERASGEHVRSVHLPLDTAEPRWNRRAVLAIFATFWRGAVGLRRMRHITSLTVDMSLYCEILSHLPQDNLLEELNVVLFATRHIDIICAPTFSGGRAPYFPVLQTLRITREDNSIPALRKSDAESILKALDLETFYDDSMFDEEGLFDDESLAGDGDEVSDEDAGPAPQFRGLTIELTVYPIT